MTSTTEFIKAFQSWMYRAKNTPLRFKLISGLVMLVVLGGFYIWLKPKSNQVSYQTTQAVKTTLVDSVSGSGQVTNTNIAIVTTKASGSVTQVLVQNGQKVTAGQKLARIKLDSSGQAAYDSALATYQSAQNSLASAQSKQLTLQATMFSSWDSYKTLAESDTYKDTTADTSNLPEFMTPQKQWLAAEADYKNQTAVIAQTRTSLAAAAKNLETTSPTLVAPIDGVVSGLSLQPGSLISAQSDSASSTTVALITTEAPPTITVNLSEVDAPSVNVGDKATISLTAYPNLSLAGQVLSIDTLGTTSSGVTVYPVVITLQGQLPKLLPNMSAQVNIITQTKDNALTVPSSAITTQNGQSYVKVMKDGTPTSVAVTTGLTADSQVEITSGLNEGDTVVTAAKSSNSGTNTSSQSIFSTFGGGNRIPGR